MTVTPNRTVRVPDDVWAHAQHAAQVEGTTVSAYIVKALRRWKPQVVVLTPAPEFHVDRSRHHALNTPQETP